VGLAKLIDRGGLHPQDLLRTLPGGAAAQT
jgi:hypothetical protein